MPARAEFTVRPRHLNRMMDRHFHLRGNDDPRFGYNDTNHPTFGMDGWWLSLPTCSMLHLHEGEDWGAGAKGTRKCVGEIKGYWSASPYAGNATNAWNVNFNNGNDNANNKTNNNDVRLVRGGA